ncbi:MAG: hypothetical protein JXR58_10540 [Bacteroidales bacterium]|nr:hypothetical protein [Bacteroidales bacterium]
MNKTINSLLIKAGANSKYINESKITFEELGMIPMERLFLLNLIEENFGIKIDKITEEKVNSPEDLLAIPGLF